MTEHTLAEIRAAAAAQVEELIYADATDSLLDFLTPEQVEQLAEDRWEGKEPTS